MKYILGIDFQANLVTVSAFTASGEPVDSKRTEYPVYEQDGISYASADDWKDAALQTIRQVIEESSIDSRDIVGIATCGHPHRVVMLDDDNCPISDSRLWSFHETFQDETGKMAQIIGSDRLNSICGKIGAVEGAMGPAILYFREKYPEDFAKCRKLLYAKDYITYSLCGNLIMDISDASGTLLFDVCNRCWSDEILSDLNISIDLLPEVLECTELAGVVSEEAASLTGLEPGTPVYAGLTNKASIAITSGAFRDGSSVPTVSDVCNIVVTSSDCFIDADKIARTYCSAVPGEYYLMVDNAICTPVIGWYGGQYMSDRFSMPKGKGGTPFKPIEEEAMLSESGANGVIFLPYLDGGVLPGFSSDSQGVFYGITPQTTKEDMLRAVLEGVSFSVLDCYKYLEQIGKKCSENYYHMPGTAPYWLQMFADITGYPAKICGGSMGGPSMGAAMVAAVASGLCSSMEECIGRFISEKVNLQPDPEKHRIYEEVYSKYRKLNEALEVMFTDTES